MQPLILTLKMDAASFERLDALRGQHFPRERNYLGAHLTLFHALPAEREAQVRADLAEVCAASAPMSLEFPALKFLGRGTAVEVRAPEVEALRRELSARWRAFLGAQDAQTIRPHVTLQNKVAPDVRARCSTNSAKVGAWTRVTLKAFHCGAIAAGLGNGCAIGRLKDRERANSVAGQYFDEANLLSAGPEPNNLTPALTQCHWAQAPL